MSSAGDTTDWNQTGYVFPPPIPTSRARDDPPNVGIAGVAMFRERQQPQPDEIIRIRYDSLDNLIALGIVAKVRPVIPVTNPFPASPQQHYVPDPPAGRRGDLH